MEENGLQQAENDYVPSRTEQDVRRLAMHVKELEEEVRELKKDLHAIDLFRKKPVLSADALGVTGFWIVAALVVIGIFF